MHKHSDTWDLIQKKMTKEGLQESFVHNLFYALGKDRYTTTTRDNLLALAMSVRDRLIERWIKTQQHYHRQNSKRVYYLSMEFLIGRLLGNNLLNLDLTDQARQALREFGLDLDKIREDEMDAGLGNGGLGRLAACFLDSMATLGIPAHGYGIRYDYGIFHQRIINGHQVEAPEEWLKFGNPWEFQRPEYAVPIKFYGEVHTSQDAHGKLKVEWRNTQDVLAVPYDIPVPGYKNDIVNTLRLWSARSSEEFDLGYFNSGDYENAVYDKMYSENISRVLYPNDATSIGRELRLKQEHFFTAASIADIIRRFKAENKDFNTLPDKVAIQLNDTHPALAVAELMRVLMDQEGVDWENAWMITIKTFAYTNHTVMPEALECWSISLLEKLLPRHMHIIYEINSRFLKEIGERFPHDPERVKRMSLIEEDHDKRVRMAYLAVVGSHSVNGVSELHSKLLKEGIFKEFYEIYPDKFNNKTNGITQRRWLAKSNPRLSQLITSKIGDSWNTQLYDMEKILGFKEDAAFREEWRRIKCENKERLARYVAETTGISLNRDSLFDVQVKRIHEYKRQVLFAFYILSQYLTLKEKKNEFIQPRTFIFAGKAAPGYFMAKLIIKFINNISDLFNREFDVRDKLRVLFLENYRVSLAEKIFPASDLSEQISTAGTEASGTGCMKFMINGALTVGTWDGANIEMAEAVGQENIFTFGLKAEEIRNLRRSGYDPKATIAKSPMLSEIFKMLQNEALSLSERGIFMPLVRNLMDSDPFFICADFDAYCEIQKEIQRQYQDPENWTRKAIINVARSGKFSSDRTIREYARDIWKVPVNS